MPLTQWDNTYEIGIHEIDDHHRKLVELLNKAYDTKLYSTDKEEIQIILEELVRYTDYHFSAEEKMLKDANFPGIKAHISRHNKFKKQLNNMMQYYISDEHHVNTDIILYLWDWLKKHILEDDMQLLSKLSQKRTHIKD